MLNTLKKLSVIAIVALAVAVPATASADIITAAAFTIPADDPSAQSTVVQSSLFRNYKPGIAMQWSAVCNQSISVVGPTSYTLAHQIVVPAPAVVPFNVTTGYDGQTVNYGAYLYRWNGSSWVYTNAYVRTSVYVNERNPTSANERDAVFNIPSSGYYAVAVYYDWIRDDTGTSAVTPYWFWAPVSENDGSFGTYCQF